MNWLSYFNGSLQRDTRKQSFAGPGTPAQEDFLSRFMAKARPDVLARGMFGMMAFDETATLPTIHVPTLVVIGDKDLTTVPEAGDYIARNIPSSLPVTLSPARHLGLFEYHSQFDQILADFAASCLATGDQHGRHDVSCHQRARWIRNADLDLGPRRLTDDPSRFPRRRREIVRTWSVMMKLVFTRPPSGGSTRTWAMRPRLVPVIGAMVTRPDGLRLN